MLKSNMNIIDPITFITDKIYFVKNVCFVLSWFIIKLLKTKRNFPVTEKIVHRCITAGLLCEAYIVCGIVCVKK